MRATTFRQPFWWSFIASKNPSTMTSGFSAGSLIARSMLNSSDPFLNPGGSLYFGTSPVGSPGNRPAYATANPAALWMGIAIPIHNAAGLAVAYAGRFPGEPTGDVPKYKLPPGFKKGSELFNIDRAIKEPAEKPLVIVEGFFDAMKLHQNGCRKVVALMGSTMTAAQEELIRKHTNPMSHVIIMLDEDEAGEAGREDIACRLSKFCFVKVHQFDTPDTQPEH